MSGSFTRQFPLAQGGSDRGDVRRHRGGHGQRCLKPGRDYWAVWHRCIIAAGVLCRRAKANAEAGGRFYALYDKISRDDILAHA
jgi:hypothetical protein